MEKYNKHCFIKKEEAIYCSKCGKKIMDDKKS